MLLPGASIGGLADTDQTASPTGTARPTGSPTGTARPTGSPGGTASPSPSPTGIQEIQFYNPSPGNSTVISTKSDGSDTTYHLVAVAREVPSNPLVEFKYQVGTANEISIGIATRVGETDAFELNWSVPTSLDGSITLKAILYNGAIEVGRDQQTATVNNSDSPESPQAETVEITYPRNGSNAGFWTPATGQAFTVVNTTSSVALAPPSTSRGTLSVTVRYTKTPPGQEPAWISCGTATPSSAGTASTRCTLASGDTPAQVTGIAAQASQQLSQLATGSGDAHRVFPYNQVPTRVTLNPESQSGKPAGACADIITATLLDQNDQPIAGANVDVHAKGPTDNLRFDDSAGNSSAHQTPDKAHTPTAGEQAWDCEGSGGSGAQGDHELSPGNPDIKHIESAAAGSGNDGTFKFQLYSPDGPGTTEIGVWADTDDDDQWCVEETSGRGSIGWTAPAATASPSPTQTASPSPTASPTRSPTSSPTARPTGTASPGATPTQEPRELGPELQNCPRPGATPTGTTTQTPPGANRSISLDASKNTRFPGRAVTLTGQITSDNPQCVNNEVVEIERRIHGTNSFRPFRTTATDDDGNYSVRMKVRRGADYQAIAPAQGPCDEATSAPETVRVRVRVTIGASDTRVGRGQQVKIIGRVNPGHDRDRVILQRKKGNRWVRVDADRLNNKSRYRFSLEADWRNRRAFRVIWPPQDDDHVRGTSRRIVIRTT
ncbi:MAG: hypothetical protein M3161_04915 [Actinomycetota bacterium]|nr:hypothetical protein [Actinomycetota bacterium]